MIVSFSYPSPARFGGGLADVYEYANGLARRDHVVHMIHGPATPDRIQRVEEIDWFEFDPRITHHIVDSLDDPALPAADAIFQPHAPARLGQPLVLIQGYGLLSVGIERPAFRAPCPKVCIATWLIEVGVAWGVPREQMLYVPLGIDHSVFRVRTPIEERPIDVAMLYTEHAVKGGADGLAALQRVRERRPSLRAVLFGRTKPPGTLPDWIEFREGLDRVGLATEVYCRTRAFVQPSWHEGLGLTAIEAMASGCALVTTDNGGSRDYALHDDTALVVPPRQPEQLGDALGRVLADDALRIRLAESGARYVRRFDWDIAAEMLEGHLQRYLADPAALQGPPSDAPMFLEQSW